MDLIDRELLSKLAFFEDVRPDVMDKLLNAAVKRRYLPGQVLLEEGTTGREMLLILEGEVEVIKGSGDQAVVLARRSAGDVFGEMAFLEDLPRFATVRAVQATVALEFSETSLHFALAENPEMLFHTTQTISSRLRKAQQLMIDGLTKKNLELERAYEELKAAQAGLVEKERLERELELARQLQQEILPLEFPSLPGFECAAHNLPARIVGGDFYDVFVLGRDQVGLVIADVSDKGMAAALFMALSRSLIRAEARRSRSPAQVLTTVNRLLREITQAEMFVTVFYGILDLSDYTLTYSRAGHDRPLLYRPASGECCFLTGKGIALGVLDEVKQEEHRIILQPGDLLALYTDGITDAQSPTGDFFSAERLQEMVCESGETSARGLCTSVFRRLADFQGEAIQFDDMSVLVVSLAKNENL